jgi:predicted cupin superfamily sugar epimerase
MQGTLTPQQIIDLLGLQPNTSEGGHFAATYTSTITLPPGEGQPQIQGRTLCSAIYYFLDRDTRSLMHKVTGDMIYHFYAGDPVEMLLLYPEGQAKRDEICVFSDDLASGGRPMRVIAGETWLGSRLTRGGRWALMGVTMSPGFDPRDYTLGRRGQLIGEYPQQASLIQELTQESNVTNAEQELFLSLSVYLTGYQRIELRGTGMLAEYFTRVTTAASDGHVQKLWSLAARLDGLAASAKGDVKSEIRRMIMDDPDLGPIARNIIKLWYRGDWPDSAAKFGASYTSAQAYREGLLWRAVKAHPPGAKPPGFGSWSTPPSE